MDPEGTVLPQGMPMRENDEKTIGRKRGTKRGNANVHESFFGDAGNERVETRPQPWPKGIESPPRGPRSSIRPSYFNILNALQSITHTTANRPIFEAKNTRRAQVSMLSDIRRSIRFFFEFF